MPLRVCPSAQSCRPSSASSRKCEGASGPIAAKRPASSAQYSGESEISLFQGSLGEHQDFLEQLLNDGPVGSVAKDGNYRERWERLDPHVPNDYRDAWRYAFAALKLLNRGAAMRARPVVHSPHPTTPDAGTIRVVEL